MLIYQISFSPQNQTPSFCASAKRRGLCQIRIFRNLIYIFAADQPVTPLVPPVPVMELSNGLTVPQIVAV